MFAPAALALVLLAAPEDPTAPDGERGFGTRATFGEVMKLLHTPDAGEQAFLDGLDGLGGELGVLVENVEGLYRSRGYFELVEKADAGLDQLVAAFRAAALDPDPLLFRRDAMALAFARMHVDTRFRARAGILAGWEYEVDQVRDGLRVLRAAANGFVSLTDAQTRAVTARVDLSAAIVRALIKDLAVLREEPGWPSTTGPAQVDVDAILALRNINDQGERAAAFEDSALVHNERANGMRAMLFTSYLAPAVVAPVDRRDGDDARAQEFLAEAWAASPDAGEADVEVAPEVARMGKTERRKLARQLALEGLELDPLDADLAYVAAVSARVVQGTLEALGHYDRFLALRGIRYNDDRTYKRRELTWEESDALLFVQKHAQAPVDPPRPAPPELPEGG